jgi:hypothetical protein
MKEVKIGNGNKRTMTIVAVVAFALLLAGAGGAYYSNMMAKPIETIPTVTPPVTPTDTTTAPTTPTTTEPEQTEPTTVKPIEITAAEFKKLIDKIYTYELQHGYPDDVRTVKRQEVEPYSNQTILVTGLVVTNINEDTTTAEKYYIILIPSESNKYYICLCSKANEISPKIGQKINIQGLLTFAELTWGGPVGYIENAQIIKDP